MRTYLVFEPVDGGHNADTAQRVRFLREKFSWPALFFTPLWLLWHRLWVGLLGWLGAVLLIAGIASVLDLGPLIRSIALLIPSLVIAFEASELRRRKLLRQGYRDAGAALGEDLEEAERRFFAGWIDRGDAPPDARAAPPRTPPPAFTPTAQSPIIGLFPEPGARR